MTRYSLQKLILGILLIGYSLPSTAQETNFEYYFKTDKNYHDVTVQAVISADTIIVENHLKEGEKIRLIGVKAPQPPKVKKEVDRDKFGFVIEERADSPETPMEELSLRFAKELLLGRKIRLEFDAQKIDDEHMTLAYAFLIDDGLFINAEMVRLGYAHMSIQPPNMKYAKQLRAAYQQARQEKRGLQGY